MLTPGQEFAHFKILQKLGEGGMGEVYLAEDLKLNRRVALKTLRDDYFDNQDRRERFEREAKTAAQISHANVMAIYDIGSATDEQAQRKISYIVMEYIPGRSLADYLKSPGADFNALLRLAEKIASGLAAAHRMNIVHRDIKAENIIVAEHDEPKILDFGLAKAIEPLAMEGGDVSGETMKKQLTTAGTVVGTVSYMSPEQVRGEAVDNRSDIFSFGVLLYRMFVGEMPFTGSSAVSILAKILESQPPAPRSKVEGLDAEMERIIDKSLQKNPNDRYQDTRDLVVDLRNLRRLHDSGITNTASQMASQVELAVKADRKKQRIKRLARVGVILLFLILVFRLGLFSPFKKLFMAGTDSSAKASTYTVAILEFDNKTGDSEFDWLQTGLPEILLTDLAQDQSISMISQRRIVDELGGEGDDLSKFSYDEQLRAAKKLGAVNVLSGSIFKLGNKIRIDARLEDVASGKIVLGEKVVSDDPLTIVDSLATRMAVALNMHGMASTERSVADLTTSSPEAYKYYHLGMQKFLDAFYDEAIVDLRKALAIDSTFALAYMRIGMCYVFQGRLQDGVPYFAEAVRFQSHLPAKDRQLLDVYADIWQRQNFDTALSKMKALVDNYPEDEESKSVYALLRWELMKDTTGSIQLLREVLQGDPKYQLALQFAVQYYRGLKQYDKAIEYGKQMQKYHPESPVAARMLAELYLSQDNIDAAIETFSNLLKAYPGDPAALTSLVECYISKRDFPKAEQYLEEFRRAHQGDSYRMGDYYDSKANLANWSGKFRTGMSYRFAGLDEAYKTGDSSRIMGVLQTIADYYASFGMKDSALYYQRKSLPWATRLQLLNYPVGLVGIDNSLASEVREMERKVVADFMARVPANLAPIGDLVQKLFEAYVAADTAKIIETLQDLSKAGGTSDGVRREIGQFYILSGHYKEGVEWLQPFVTGKDQTTSGYYFPYDNYLLGVAQEGLGDRQAAIKYYREMLKYWSNPEIEIKPIRDAKARLARLAA